jgi:hypothetical protein
MEQETKVKELEKENCKLIGKIQSQLTETCLLKEEITKLQFQNNRLLNIIEDLSRSLGRVN